MSASAPAHANGSGRMQRLLLDRRYQRYVLAVLFLGYVFNVIDRGVLSVLQTSIKHEFGWSNAQLGFLYGVPFALFYSTLGLFFGVWADRVSRRAVLGLSIALWTTATALCGAAGSYPMMLLARVGTAVGEAGGTPPSHALISDYFPAERRATALAVYALGVPVGGALGSYFGGLGNDLFGWRETFVLVGLPGLIVAALARFTILEPPRGHADGTAASGSARAAAPRVTEVFKFLWQRSSFRHMCLAAGLHAIVWYAGSSFNPQFLQVSHQMSAARAGFWTGLFSGISGIGTFLGGWLADRMSVRLRDSRWYMWLPGCATLAMIPFQFTSYLPGSLWLAIPSFCVMLTLGAFFFGPSFAMSQGLATFRMRALSTSLLLLVQTALGLGIGPWLTGFISDRLKPSLDTGALRYALVIVGLINLWSAGHYFWGARSVRGDLEATAHAARN